MRLVYVFYFCEGISDFMWSPGGLADLPGQIFEELRNRQRNPTPAGDRLRCPNYSTQF